MIEDHMAPPAGHPADEGPEKPCFESDYPHGDGTWPDTQQVIEDVIGHLPVEEIRKITHENAAVLFNHPLPAVRVP